MTDVTPVIQPLSPEGLEPIVEDLHPELSPVLGAGVTASELLLQLGHEYFTVYTETNPSNGTALASERQLPLDPRTLALSSPPLSEERDFWEEVAAASARADSWPVGPNGVKTFSDPVAHAIAMVSASYTLPASEKRLTNQPAAGLQPLQTLAKEQPKSSPPDSGPHGSALNADVADALASLLGLEQMAGPSNLGDLAPETFTRVRELAAQALVAAFVNRSSTLKSAEGRRG